MQREEEEETGRRVNHLKEQQGITWHRIPETKWYRVIGPDRGKTYASPGEVPSNSFEKAPSSEALPILALDVLK